MEGVEQQLAAHAKQVECAPAIFGKKGSGRGKVLTQHDLVGLDGPVCIAAMAFGQPNEGAIEIGELLIDGTGLPQLVTAAEIEWLDAIANRAIGVVVQPCRWLHDVRVGIVYYSAKLVVRHGFPFTLSDGGTVGAMGLFRKKAPKAPKPGKQPKPPKPGKQPKPTKPPKPGKQPKPAKPPKPAKQAKAEKPPKPEKGLVRGVVDPADFIALRFEMVDLRARLEASEQSKAIVETRLEALDAGNAMARPPRDGGLDGEVRHRIAEFEAQLALVASAVANASATAETAAATATATATALENLPAPAPAAMPTPMPIAPPVLSAPVGPDPTLVARLDEFEKLIGDLAVKIAEPAPISDHAGAIESIVGQVAQLNARVSAQAELGAQLSSLRDRIGELQIGAVSDDGSSANVQALTYRVEVLAERMETSEARARQTAEQLSAIEHRMNAVSTELTNQVSELGRDIDGFGSYVPDTATASAGNPSNGASSNGSGLVSAELLAELQEAQIRLAAEQARYEIAFRQDLAALAEHIRSAR